MAGIKMKFVILFHRHFLITRADIGSRNTTGPDHQALLLSGKIEHFCQQNTADGIEYKQQADVKIKSVWWATNCSATLGTDGNPSTK